MEPSRFFLNEKASTGGIEEGYVYFVHSYVVEAPDELMAAKADYGCDVPAIVEKDLVFGMQFHPEKKWTSWYGITKTIWGTGRKGSGLNGNDDLSSNRYFKWTVCSLRAR